jgi:hypothetical protein
MKGINSKRTRIPKSKYDKYEFGQTKRKTDSGDERKKCIYFGIVAFVLPAKAK